MAEAQPRRELSLWLDDFDDIYSDFDPRHYLRRRISDDFIHELKVSLKSREKAFSSLLLLIPAKKRNEELEKAVITSLHNYFTQQYYFYEDKYRAVVKRGLSLLIAGILVMSIDFILNIKFEKSIPLSMMRVILEPGSWFLVWAGLDKLYYDRVELKSEKDIFRALDKMKIHFGTSD
jgi:hypothetical protein